jgi:hypothetical protein
MPLEMQAGSPPGPESTQPEPKVGRAHELASISSLPPEVLARIFRFTQQLYIRSSRRPLRWVKQTAHICSFWRDVALSDPYLWTYLPMLHRDQWNLYDMFLERSRPLGITFEILLSMRFKAPFVRLISPEFSNFLSDNATRIEGLVLFSGTPDFFRTLRSDVPGLRLPFLKRVEFVTWKRDKDPEERCPVYHMRQLAGSLHGLEELILPCPPHWEFAEFKNLVSLTVHNRGSLKRPVRSTFMLALEQIGPRLQYLCLTDIVLPGVLDCHPRFDPVNLPRLQQLHISDDILELTDFLRSIAFPDTTHLNLVCKSKSIDELSSAINEARSSIFRADRSWIRSMQIMLDRMGSTRSMTFEAWPFVTKNSEHIKHLTVSDYTALVSLKLVWQGLGLAPSSEIRHVMQEVIGNPHFENLEFLALNSKVEIVENTLTPSVLVEIFGQLPHLWSMFVKGIFLEPCIHALVPQVDDPETMGKSCVPFSALRHLHLEDDLVYPDHGALFHSQKLPRYRHITLVETLAENLDIRLDQNAGIDSLILENCFFLVEEDVELLQDLVDVVFKRTFL